MIQVIRDVVYTCENKAVWELCLKFYLLLKLHGAIRQVFKDRTFCWSFGEIIINMCNYIAILTMHFSILTTSPLPSVFLVIIIS